MRIFFTSILLSPLTPLLLGLLIGYILGIKRDKNKVLFDKKLLVYSEILSVINKNDYIDNSIDRTILINLFSPARLLAGKTLEEKLRNYYSLVTDYWKLSSNNIEEKIKLQKQISQEVMGIEQLMRCELGSSQLYSFERIKKHTQS